MSFSDVRLRPATEIMLTFAQRRLRDHMNKQYTGEFEVMKFFESVLSVASSRWRSCLRCAYV